MFFQNIFLLTPGQAPRNSQIKSIIQEIVNDDMQLGYTESSPIVIMIDGVCKRTAVSYHGDEDQAPKLYVTYQSLSCPDENEEVACNGSDDEDHDEDHNGNDDDDDDDDHEGGDDDNDGGSFTLDICGNGSYEYTVYTVINDLGELGNAVYTGDGDGETEEEISNLPPGTYTVLVTDANDVTTSCTFEIGQEEDCDDDDDDDGDRLAGEASESETNVHLRPNPTEYQDVEVIIEITGGQRYTKHTILVSDISGRVIINESLELHEGINTYIIPNEILANGMYFVRIQNQKGDVFVLRFVKVDEG